MAQITKQSGAASSTPSVVKRWVLSFILTRMVDERRQAQKRTKQEANRQKQGRRHVVEYFHQVEDGYSHLAIQTLKKLH
ncbi:MAG: 2-hydroxychromene-2-carboxylate isomerase, partial [Pseudomonadota bacterium]